MNDGKKRWLSTSIPHAAMHRCRSRRLGSCCEARQAVFFDPSGQIAITCNNPHDFGITRTKIWDLVWCCAIHFQSDYSYWNCFQNRRGRSWKTVDGVPCEQCCSTSALVEQDNCKEAEKQQCGSLLPTSVLCLDAGNAWNRQPTDCSAWKFETVWDILFVRWRGRLLIHIHIIDPIIAGSVM